MKLQEILRSKGSHVYSIRPDATLADAVQALVQHNCGSLVVCEPDASKHNGLGMVGIITERDILRACAARLGPLDALGVGDTMTTRVVTASPADSVEDTMGLMTEKRIRHLPVVEAGELAGMISIGDVVKAQHHLMAVENYYLKSYIQS